MLPWKLFFRFLSALALMATGGFAAGHDLPLPFDGTSTEVAAPPTTVTTLPAPDTAVPSDPAATPPPADDSTTTTTMPDPTAPDLGDPVLVPGTPPVVPVPTTPKPATPSTTAPPAAPADPAPAAPVDGDAPSVCAAAATMICGPADPAPTADDSTAARVARCQDWWNSLADAFDHNGRPEWAARARQISARCEAMIARWQQMEQRWQERQKGDHIGDGQPDNGKGPRQDGQDGQDGHDGKDDHRSPPPAQPQAKQVSRHGEGRH
ncbi:MAG TPA: hypothetical protein VGR20_02625 [Acidimicrobiia bacterium]|nr:hypothetical protein [Acidimicrobiia bacterium]